MDGTISDSELRNMLKSYGFQPGPITETTRAVYLKKLQKLAAGPHASPSKPRTSRASSKDNRPCAPDLPPSEPPISVSQTSRHLSIDSTNNSTQLRRRSIGRASSPGRAPFKTPEPPSTQLSTPISSRLSQSNDTHARRSFASPMTAPMSSNSLARETTPQRGAGHTPTRKTYVYFKHGYSESDTEDDTDRTNSLSNTMSRVAGWLRRTSEYSRDKEKFNRPDSSRRSILSWTRSPAQDDRQIYVSDSDVSDVEGHNHKRRSVTGSRGVLRDTGTATTTSLLLTPPRFLERTPKSSSRPGLSILSDDASTYNRFGTDSFDREPSSPPQKNLVGRLFSGFVSHIPNLILLFGVLVVGSLVVSYVSMRDHHGEVGKLADLQRIVCASTVPHMENTVELHQCLHQDKLDEALPMVSKTYDILSRYAGEYHCGSITRKSAKMHLRTARGLLEREWLLSQSELTSFSQIWENALFVILHLGKVHFHITTYGANGNDLGPSNHIMDIYELESTRPYFSGSCRLRRSIIQLWHLVWNAVSVALIIALIVGITKGIQWILNRRRSKLEQKNARIRDLVGEIVHMLQQQLRVNESNPVQPPYIPVHLIRDRLRMEHPDSQSLWPDLSRYVYDVETCIEVREWRGIGETWQWQGGTGWQGSAILDKSQKPPFVVPPTECVKIRNMFSVDSLDERSKLRIKRELLKKLVDCGPILHIGLDSVGSKGLVYVKCANPDTAGRVFYAVHANYFDSRLVTVKFLRDTKYCLRFPEAHGLRQPLAIRDLE